jgi:hypothetical protein
MPKGTLAYDLDPKIVGIIKTDFFDVKLSKSNILTIGNPPFGKNSSLAVSFFNHAATFSEAIAFILPRTFRKPSIVNRLHPSFHIIHDEILPDNSFIHEGNPYDVPCVFQIWEWKQNVRKKITTLSKCEDFEFTTNDNANIAVQRVGVNAGRIKHDLDVSEQSHYFIRCSDQVINVFRTLDFNDVKHNTAGNPSISKHELISLYKKALDNTEAACYPVIKENI